MMLKITLTAAFLLLCSSPAVLAAEGKAFSGYLSFWTQTCSGASCSLPKPVSLNRPLAFTLNLPGAPGEAAAISAREVLWPDTDSPLIADVSVYAVCPYVSAPRAGGEACAGLYYQAQLTLTGAAETFCSAALNAADALPWPVMTCGGRSAPGTRLGVTLHRRSY